MSRYLVVSMNENEGQIALLVPYGVGTKEVVQLSIGEAEKLQRELRRAIEKAYRARAA